MVRGLVVLGWELLDLFGVFGPLDVVGKSPSRDLLYLSVDNSFRKLAKRQNCWRSHIIYLTKHERFFPKVFEEVVFSKFDVILNYENIKYMFLFFFEHGCRLNSVDIISSKQSHVVLVHFVWIIDLIEVQGYITITHRFDHCVRWSHAQVEHRVLLCQLVFDYIFVRDHLIDHILAE